jgi:hypothetical protein
MRQITCLDVVAKTPITDSTRAESIPAHADYTVAAAGTNTDETLIAYGESETRAILRYTQSYTVPDQPTVKKETLAITGKPSKNSASQIKSLVKRKQSIYTDEAPPTNILALISFGLGMLGIVLFFTFFGGLLLGIGAIVIGFIARRQIKRKFERGKGFATAGIAMGILLVLLTALLVALLIAAFSV